MQIGMPFRPFIWESHTKLCGLATGLAIAAVFAGLATLGIELARLEGRVAAVWLPNAALLAALFWRRLPISIKGALVCSFLGNIAANLLAGDPIQVSIGLAVANAAEVALAYATLTRLHPGVPDMSDFAHLRRFCLIAVAVPLGPAAIATAVLWSATLHDAALTYASCF